MADTVLVSCIMPTCGRPALAARAAGCFLQQDQPRRELVVVTDDPPGLRRVLPRDPRIRVVGAAPGASIGALRNTACRHARGQVIAHWDDDDWHGPHRLTRQVAPLVDGRADITALRDVLFLDTATGRFWRCSPSLHRRIFRHDVHGGTLVYRRSIWERGARYPDTSLAEDADFLDRAAAAGARLRPLAAGDEFVYVRHAANAWAFRCGHFVDRSGWRPATPPRWRVETRLAYGPFRDTTALPLVSCVMPTRGRPLHVRRAVEHFRRQHYPNRELVVVGDADDTDGDVADLLPADPRIRHVRVPGGTALGAKRNTACRLARGSFIAHWDDDDWYSDHRLDLQVGELLVRGAELCGASSLYFLDPAARAAWRFRHLGRFPWFAGTSLCYRRTVWASRPFEERAAGEDNHFVLAAAGRAAVDVGASNCVVAVLHGANTSSTAGRDRRWTPVPVSEVEEVMGADPALPHRSVTAAAPARTGCPT